MSTKRISTHESITVPHLRNRDVQFAREERQLDAICKFYPASLGDLACGYLNVYPSSSTR